MIVYNSIQGTEQWFADRLGIPTASCATKVLAKGKGKTRYSYMMELLADRMMFDAGNKFQGNADTERGTELEPEARALYAFENDVEPEQVGFITDDDRTAGASPDSLVGANGLIEIKAKIAHIHLPVLLTNKVPTEHLPQVQMQIWIAEREWCDFVSYCPGLPLVTIRVNRDEAKIKEIAEEIKKFNDELSDLEAKLRSMQ